MRNQWLVDNSDIIICYVKQDGGAYKTKKYSVHMSRRQYPFFKEQMFIIGGEQI